MAKFEPFGVEALSLDVQTLKSLTGNDLLRILTAGANVLWAAYQRMLEKLELIDTNTLVSHIGVKQSAKRSGVSVTVTPMEIHHYYKSRKSGRRVAAYNSGVAYELEYGNVDHKAYHPLEKAIAECNDAITEAEQAEFNVIMAGKRPKGG